MRPSTEVGGVGVEGPMGEGWLLLHGLLDDLGLDQPLELLGGLGVGGAGLVIGD